MSKAEKEAPAKKSKLPVILIAVAALAGGGAAGGAVFFMKKGPVDPAVQAEALRKAALKSRVFVPLEPFTVNLADTRESRLAQIGIVLEVPSNETAEEIKTVMPIVRSRILTLVSSKQARELLSTEGKEQLTLQIADATAILIGHEPPSKASKPGDGNGHAVAAAGGHGAPARPIVEVNLSSLVVQ